MYILCKSQQIPRTRALTQSNAHWSNGSDWIMLLRLSGHITDTSPMLSNTFKPSIANFHGWFLGLPIFPSEIPMLSRLTRPVAWFKMFRPNFSMNESGWKSWKFLVTSLNARFFWIEIPIFFFSPPALERLPSLLHSVLRLLPRYKPKKNITRQQRL